MTKKEIQKMAEESSARDFSQHPDLKALVVCGEEFGEPAEFNELIFVVPTEWLKKTAQNVLGIAPEHLQYWLTDEYTSDESFEIFSRACIENQIHIFQFD